MKRAMMVLVLAAIALSVMGHASQRAEAGLVDDVKSLIFGEDAQDREVPDPKKLREGEVVDIQAHPDAVWVWGQPPKKPPSLPPSCSTGLAHAESPNLAWNQSLTATASCTLGYGGPNLNVLGVAAAWKNVYSGKDQKCSGDPCVVGEVMTGPQILVELLFGDEVLLSCDHSQPEPASAICERQKKPSTDIPLGAVLECRVTAWAPSARELNALGICDTGIVNTVQIDGGPNLHGRGGD